MPKVFRISGIAYAPQDPTGAALSSEGRWHRKGQRVLYFSNSLSTCVLELRANGISYKTMRKKNHYCEAKIPDDIVAEVVPSDFYVAKWQQSKAKSQEFGSKWFIESRSLLLNVKSAVISAENNLVANTNHPDFHRIVFSQPFPMELDPRLMEKEDSEKKK